MPRTSGVGRSSPMPVAWERTRFFWRARTSVAEMRVSESAPKPVLTPYTLRAASPAAVISSMAAREASTFFRASGSTVTARPRRATSSSDSSEMGRPRTTGGPLMLMGAA